MPGFWQILIIVLVILIIFGGKKLPELGRSIGKSIKEFNKSKNENISAPIVSTDHAEKENMIEKERSEHKS